MRRTGELVQSKAEHMHEIAGRMLALAEGVLDRFDGNHDEAKKLRDEARETFAEAAALRREALQTRLEAEAMRREGEKALAEADTLCA